MLIFFILLLTAGLIHTLVFVYSTRRKSSKHRLSFSKDDLIDEINRRSVHKISNS